MSDRPSPVETEFLVFCDAVQGWLAAAPELDPALAAVAQLVTRQRSSTEREVAILASRPDDALVALGASTLLSLWAATRSGALELVQVGGV